VKAVAGVAAVIAITVATLPAPASAQGLFEYLFGGFRRPPPAPPVQINTPSDFLHSMFDNGPRQQEAVRGNGGGGSGPYAAFCVRLCDGRYFPIQGRHNASAAEQCHAACPATATRVYSGGGIDHAVASDGSRYSDLPNAFVYRKHIVSSCTCNGKTNYSLARVPIGSDPTLRPGDVVATNSGFTVYNGRNPNDQAAFTPIDSARVSKSLRSQLADVKVTPRSTTGAAPEPDTTATVRSDNRRVSARER
jgi:hypothetical protein